MPPKRNPPSTSKSNSKAATISSTPRSQIADSNSGVGGALKGTYDALTAKENQSIVKAVGMFGVAVAFLASSYGELLSEMVPL